MILFSFILLLIRRLGPCPLSPQARNLNKPPKVNYLKNSINITLKKYRTIQASQTSPFFWKFPLALINLTQGRSKKAHAPLCAFMRLYVPPCVSLRSDSRHRLTDSHRLTHFIISSFHNKNSIRPRMNRKRCPKVSL